MIKKKNLYVQSSVIIIYKKIDEKWYRSISEYALHTDWRMKPTLSGCICVNEHRQNTRIIPSDVCCVHCQSAKICRKREWELHLVYVGWTIICNWRSCWNLPINFFSFTQNIYLSTWCHLPWSIQCQVRTNQMHSFELNWKVKNENRETALL